MSVVSRMQLAHCMMVYLWLGGINVLVLLWRQFVLLHCKTWSLSLLTGHDTEKTPTYVHDVMTCAAVTGKS